MLSIFISHDWNQSHLYQRLTALLDAELGRKGWRNLSIPDDEALELRGYDRFGIENSLDRLEDEIVRLEAGLHRPGLR
jgi:hypothetical protein